MTKRKVDDGSERAEGPAKSRSGGSSAQISQFFRPQNAAPTPVERAFWSSVSVSGWDAVSALTKTTSDDADGPEKPLCTRDPIINVYGVPRQFACPVCAQRMPLHAGSNAVHVNRCLDSGASRDRKDPPDDNKHVLSPAPGPVEIVDLDSESDFDDRSNPGLSAKPPANPTVDPPIDPPVDSTTCPPVDPAATRMTDDVPKVEDPAATPSTMGVALKEAEFPLDPAARPPLKGAAFLPDPPRVKAEAPNLWNKLMTRMTQSVQKIGESVAFGAPPAKVKAEAGAAPAAGAATKAPPDAEERGCPWYKKMPATTLTVDAFRFGAVPGCTGYLLSHFHSDHYGGLTAAWRHGPIYCSQITADLCVHQLKVKEEYMRRLPMDTVVDVEGCKVMLVDANHCPGSVIFTIQPPRADYVHVHTGDFRYARALHRPALLLEPHRRFGATRVHTAYLDTTYLGPKHTFPAQGEVIGACADYVARVCASEDQWTELVLRAMQEKGRRNMEDLGKWMVKLERGKEEQAGTSGNAPPPPYKVLICVGTYLIGKERVFTAIADALGTHIWADDRKRKILEVMGDASWMGKLAAKPGAGDVHLCRLGEVNNPDGLSRYLSTMRAYGYTHLMAFRPTGWTFKPPPAAASAPGSAQPPPPPAAWSPVPQVVTRDGKVAVFGVPYSEHSSFAELRGFVKAHHEALRVIPTVNNGSAKSRERMSYWIDRWRAEARKEVAATGGLAEDADEAVEKDELLDDDDDDDDEGQAFEEEE